MRFTLTIDCDNAAFSDGDQHDALTAWGAVRALLGDLSQRGNVNPHVLTEDEVSGRIRDTNGNTVGEFALTRED